MIYLRRFAHFWYDFVVGDDWTIAAAVVVALVMTGVLTRAQLAGWWLLPTVVITFLGISLFQATRT